MNKLNDDGRFQEGQKMNIIISAEMRSDFLNIEEMIICFQFKVSNSEVLIRERRSIGY
jgi:hypothetical protein